jgi:hypothetical protein
MRLRVLDSRAEFTILGGERLDGGRVVVRGLYA